MTHAVRPFLVQPLNTLAMPISVFPGLYTMPLPCRVRFKPGCGRQAPREKRGWGIALTLQTRADRRNPNPGPKTRRESMRQPILVFLWLMTSAAASADQVTLQNGDRLTG